MADLDLNVVELMQVVGWVGIHPGRDRWGGKRVVGGMLPRINIGADVWGDCSIMTGFYQRW